MALTVTEHIRHHLERCLRPRPDLESLRESEWSPQFEQYMRNRLIMGSLRYVTFAEKKKSHCYDLLSYAFAKLELYKQTGNQEALVDCANICMIEFECPTHPHAHFSSQDDGTHVPTL